MKPRISSLVGNDNSFDTRTYTNTRFSVNKAFPELVKKHCFDYRFSNFDQSSPWKKM